ncbi:MAG: type IV toxin-antitoxin system AbiEi family antitoxin domain-containing protein [Actinomycetota bacterium]
MPGRVYTELLEVANDQYGYVTAGDARAAGIDPVQLRVMSHRGLLDRVARGIYRFPVVPTTALDQYMEAVLWPRTTAALGHETALDLHGLCDVNPARIHVTVPAGYRLRRDVPTMYQLHRRDLAPNDTTRHEGIPIVTVHRAILDGIEVNLGGHLIDQAIDTARRRGRLTPTELRALTRVRRRRPREGRRRAEATAAAHG